MTSEELDVLAKKVLQAAFRIHTAFGPGLLESAYCACLVFELSQIGLQVRTEVPVPVVYQGVKLADVGYRIDILVENEVVLEIKAIEAIAPVHLAQLVSYFKAVGQAVGFPLELRRR